MQGWPHFIDTELKINYINALLKVGFHTIDFGSFVSPKAIPQMRDTREVLEKLDVGNGPEDTRLLAIVANLRGAEEAVYYEKISYLGFPFSISETFQQRNTNSSIADSFNVVDQIQQLCRTIEYPKIKLLRREVTFVVDSYTKKVIYPCHVVIGAVTTEL